MFTLPELMLIKVNCLYQVDRLKEETKILHHAGSIDLSRLRDNQSLLTKVESRIEELKEVESNV